MMKKTMYFKAWQTSMADKDGIKKWFPRLVKKKKVVTAWDIAVEISKRSSLTPGDSLNFLLSMFDIVGDELMNGYSVKFDQFGTFTAIANAKGNGVDTFEEVNSSQIGALRIRFTPAYTRTPINGTTRSMFEGVSFERIDIQEESDDNDSGNNSGGGDDGGWVDPSA